MTRDHHTTRLRRYTLGALPEEERAAIEEGRDAEQARFALGVKLAAAR